MREDWIECTLKEVLLHTKAKHKPIQIDNLFYVGLEHIEKETGRLTSSVKIDEIKTVKNKFESGQILYGKLRPYFNKVHLTNQSGVCSTDILVFQPSKSVQPKFALNYMMCRQFVNEMSANMNGVNLPRVSTSKVTSYKFPLPPLVEQKTIVKKIEALFSSLDSGISDLKKAQDQLVIYRQAVLKKAFEGELTKEWRAKQTNLPSADELLELIKVERQKHYETQVSNWKEAIKEWEKSDKTGKKPSRISKPKNFPEVKLEEVENYDSIPNSWFWTRFGTITYKIGDIDHKMPKTVENGMPYVSTGNIGKDGKIDFDKAKQISRIDFDRLALKIKPEKGDIIFPRYGTIGRNILIDYDKEFLVSYSCAIIKNITKIMDEKFALYYSLSPVIKREINRYVVETTQANIGIASIERFVYPLCSKQEQHQIVLEIESRLSVCDKVEKDLTDSLEKALALRQSILKKAFEGTLLSEKEIAKCKADKEYEPASVLLERIKAEKKK